MTDQLSQLQKSFGLSIDQIVYLFKQMIDNPPLIAGPWVPFKGELFRYDLAGRLPIAKASSAEQIGIEDQRLEELGYQIIDRDRKIPESWFKK